MRKKLLASFRAGIAVLFMMFATNIASISAVAADATIAHNSTNPTVCPDATGIYQEGNNCKITICHRTDSVTNPYSKIGVDLSAADGVAGNSGNQADHYSEHQGPVFNSTMTNDSTWGDIIPPIPGTHSGLNWTTAGQSIWTNDCNVPQPTHVTAAAVTFNDVCGTQNDSYTVPSAGSGYTYSESAGTKPGADTVTVTASAVQGYVLDGASSWSHTFTDTDCPPASTHVTATAVTFHDVCGTTNDTYTVPVAGTGYHYSETSGTKPGSGTVLITATAQQGYVLDGTTSWSHTFTNTECPPQGCPPSDLSVTTQNEGNKDCNKCDEHSNVVSSLHDKDCECHDQTGANSSDDKNCKCDDDTIAHLSDDKNCNKCDEHSNVVSSLHDKDCECHDQTGANSSDDKDCGNCGDHVGFTSATHDEECRCKGGELSATSTNDNDCDRCDSTIAHMGDSDCDRCDSTIAHPGDSDDCNTCPTGGHEFSAPGSDEHCCQQDAAGLVGMPFWQHNKDHDNDCKPPKDVCPNLPGNQATVPEGYVKDEHGNCVKPPTDVCKNIEGVQTQVPAGMVVDKNGNCFTPGMGGGGGEGGGTSTPPSTPTTVTTLVNANKLSGGRGGGTAPASQELVNTGSASLLGLVTGLAVIGLAGVTAFTSRRTSSPAL